MNVIDSKSLERDAGGKVVAAFPHPALGESLRNAVEKGRDRRDRPQRRQLLARRQSRTIPRGVDEAKKAERRSRVRAELMPSQGLDDDEIMRAQLMHARADEAAPAPAQWDGWSACASCW